MCIRDSRDVPRKWVVSDELIVEACKRAPRTLDRLRRIRGAESLGERDAKALIEAVGRGASCPAEKCPSAKRKDRPSPDTESVIDLMYAMLRLVAERSGVATQLIATRDDLLEFVSHREESRLAHSWRYELAGRQLADLLEGKVGLTVKDGRVETL